MTFDTHGKVQRDQAGKFEIYTRTPCPRCGSFRGTIRMQRDEPDFDIRNV